ncbi:hypothetical protein [Paludibaculum fermentans]|uniref:hypothetical protein n=1 Tax=Paludibaculum fermentans TaxID=1473598 RepID=UPI003EB7E4CD
MRCKAVLVLAGVLAGCSRNPQFAPLPEQLAAVEAPDPPPRPCFAAMSEPRVKDFIVNDISGSGWKRWTAARPTVRCTLPRDGQWLAAFDFEVAEATLRDTGPITLTFEVNGQQVGSLRCDHAAGYQFRAPVPKGLGPTLTLTAIVDKPWVSPGDGAPLGVLLTAAGFLQE